MKKLIFLLAVTAVSALGLVEPGSAVYYFDGGVLEFVVIGGYLNAEIRLDNATDTATVEISYTGINDDRTESKVIEGKESIRLGLAKAYDASRFVTITVIGDRAGTREILYMKTWPPEAEGPEKFWRIPTEDQRGP